MERRDMPMSSHVTDMESTILHSPQEQPKSCCENMFKGDNLNFILQSSVIEEAAWPSG